MTSIGGDAGAHPPPSVPQWVINPDCTGLFMHLCILLLYYIPCFTAAGGEQQSKIISEVNCRTSFVYLCYFIKVLYLGMLVCSLYKRVYMW